MPASLVGTWSGTVNEPGGVVKEYAETYVIGPCDAEGVCGSFEVQGPVVEERLDSYPWAQMGLMFRCAGVLMFDKMDGEEALFIAASKEASPPEGLSTCGNLPFGLTPTPDGGIEFTAYVWGKSVLQRGLLVRAADSTSASSSSAPMDPGLAGLWSGSVTLAPSRTDSAIGVSEIPWLTTVMIGPCTPGKECGGWSNSGLNSSGWGIGCTSSLRYSGVDQGAFTFDEVSTLRYGAITQCQGDCRLSLTPASADRLDVQIGCQNHGYRVDAQGSLERVTGAP